MEIPLAARSAMDIRNVSMQADPTRSVNGVSVQLSDLRVSYDHGATEHLTARNSKIAGRRKVAGPVHT